MNLDVLIAGAGPVGLSAALFLARHGLHVRIIDRSQGPAPESRAIGIQPRTLEIFEMAGVVEPFVAQGYRLGGVSLHGERGEKIGRVAFDTLPTRYPFLMTLAQSQTEQILIDRLGELGIEVERQTTLDSFTEAGNHITASISLPDGSKSNIDATWLIGADGARSTVRQILAMPFAGKTYDLNFLLADLHVDSELSNKDALIFAKREGLLAMFPLGGKRYRLVADNPPGEYSEQRKPSLAEWQQLVDRRVAAPVRLHDPNWTAYFRVHSRMVEHIRKGRVFLMGDAAHIHSPALAQGMNTGIHDAWNLAWKMALVCKGAALPRLLDSYEAERLPVERRVLAMTDFTQNVVATENRFRQVLRDLLLPIAIHIPFVQEKAAENVSELAVGYRTSAIVAGHRAHRAPRAGDRAPDATMLDAAGREVRLMSLFGHRHLLLAITRPADVAAAAQLFSQLPGRYVNYLDTCLVNDGVVTREVSAGHVLKQDGTTFGERYGRDSAYVLIRPDGYVAFRSDISHPRDVENFLAQFFSEAAPGN